MPWRPTNSHHLHRAQRLLLLLILTVAGVAGLGIPAASAQGRGGAGGFAPCGLGQLASNQIWTQADVVFAARPITNESAPSSAGGFDSTLSRVTVTEVFKGLVAKEIVLAATGRPCGSATTDAILGATRQDDGTYRLVGSVSREQAAAYGGTLPATSGTGPIRGLVGVDGGPVDLVAVDGEGVPLGYRLGSSPPVLLTMCPGARTALSFQGNPSDPPSARRLEVIDIATMTTRRRVPWRDPNSPTAIACQDADAGAVAAFVPTQRPDQFGPPGQPGPSGPFGEFDESGPAVVVPPGGGVSPGRGVPGPPATLAPSPRATTTTTTGGKVLRFQNQKPTEIAVSFSEVVGVDAQGGFLSWADATATTLVASDPVTGQPARSTKMPDGLQGQTVAVSDDGRRAVVLAVHSAAPGAGGVEHTPVVVDLTGGAETKVLPPRPGGLPIRLGFVADDIVVVHTATTFSTQGQITTDVIALDGTLKSSTPSEIDASAEAARAVPPGFPAGVPVPGLEGQFDARPPEQVPRLFGVKVGATVFVPAAAVAIDPAAATPRIAATPRLNNGLPLEIDRTPEDRVAIASAAVTASLLLFMFGGLWGYRAPRNP